MMNVTRIKALLLQAFPCYELRDGLCILCYDLPELINIYEMTKAGNTTEDIIGYIADRHDVEYLSRLIASYDLDGETMNSSKQKITNIDVTFVVVAMNRQEAELLMKD
ncbi:MAG: hypothetical protein AAF629_28240, partial [Chloroflexota bacterium]